MTIPIEFVALFLGVAIAACGWMIRYLISAVNATNTTLQSIADHLGKLNGRVGKAESWQLMHEKQDDERYEGIEREQTRIWTEIERGRL